MIKGMMAFKSEDALNKADSMAVDMPNVLGRWILSHRSDSFLVAWFP